MAEQYFAASVSSEVARHASRGDWSAAESAEEEDIAVRVPVQMARTIDVAPWGSCPLDFPDLDAAREAELSGSPELATRIKNDIDERHARCLAGCALKEVANDCIAE